MSRMGENLMLTRFETRKLEDEMRRELDEPSHTLWKCAAGLCFVTALALIGAGWTTATEGSAYAVSASSR